MNEHWTLREVEALNVASTFEEITQVALTILSRMSGCGQPIVQICGPISTGGLGDLRKNLERFDKAVKKASERGLIVFNQLPFQTAIERIDPYTGTDGYCMEILEVFYHGVFHSGLINKTLFLPGWEGSIGATWERAIVSKLGIEIEEYPEEWLRGI